MKINIRQATLDDYSAMCELYEEIDTQHREHLPHIFKQPDGPEREMEYYARQINDKNTVYFVAEVESQIVGFVQVIMMSAPDFPILQPRRYALVECLIVKESNRHQGIGKMLMNKMQEWVIANEISEIELNVHEFNQGAIAFYEGLGFEAVSRKMSKGLG